MVDNADYSNKIDMTDERQNAFRSHDKLEKEALLVVNDEQLSVEKQKTLNMAFEWRQYERCLTTLQQNSGGYSDDEEDYHNHTKKLLPSVSRYRATERDDDRQQPYTYVAGETYKNSHVLSEIFLPLQPVREEIRKDKTTDHNISMTRDKLRSIVSNALEEQKSLVNATRAEAIKAAFSEGIKKGSELGHYLDQGAISLRNWDVLNWHSVLILRIILNFRMRVFH